MLTRSILRDTRQKRPLCMVSNNIHVPSRLEYRGGIVQRYESGIIKYTCEAVADNVESASLTHESCIPSGTPMPPRSSYVNHEPVDQCRCGRVTCPAINSLAVKQHNKKMKTKKKSIRRSFNQ